MVSNPDTERIVTFLTVMAIRAFFDVAYGFPVCCERLLAYGTFGSKPFFEQTGHPLIPLF